ncbi:gustatory receptor for bitter taste 66a-like [Teleopsis dalmanni]|uniref:gustatory receptor for bitter taste 66a-like n=1 Tax=Teleopsis dalmanni TaxID=139649 RepID=UPI0018CF1BEA|nr:gustatory receptor for bitter taste 66a-like [Teleopsis dalmanni]
MIDQISAVKNQNRLGGFFNRLQALDQNLLEQSIHIDNRLITLRIRFMVALAVIFELSIFTSTYVLLLDYTEWISLFWIFSRIPEIFNTFDKIWFLALLVALKQRFTALNETFEELAERHEKFKNIGVVLNPKGFGIVNTTSVENKLLQSLHGNSNKVFPKPDNNFGHFQKRFHSYFANELNDFEHTKIKFSKLCQLHDGICSLAQELSELWCYPMLILMAYGFSTSTALLYFYYCASESQLIPTFFRVAKDPVITVIYLIYIAGKCVSIMYLSWKTSLESKRTGICLHRCAVVVDKNEMYEIVNHLSLKLLNHAVDFSACGFFTLNMRTLYAIIGGISSYLVILIQFNIAGEQIKKPYISPVPKEFFGFENVTYPAD